MGGSSTSHSAVLGNGNPATGSLDLRSWQGLTEVLRVGKQHLRDPYAYAEFRNLVLEYAQKGGDEEMRKKIDAMITSFSAPMQQPEGQHASSADAPIHTPTTTSQHTEVDVQKNAMEAATLQDAIVLPPTSPLSPVIGRTRVVPQFLPQSLQAQTRENEIASSIVDTPTPPTPTPSIITPPTDIQTPPPPPTTQPPAYATLEEYKARIAEIKRSVHDRIGNPATLIDTHNDIGKKYMGALLTALKATSPGSDVGIQTAMTALEEAYQRLITHPTDTQTPSVEAHHEAENFDATVAATPSPLVRDVPRETTSVDETAGEDNRIDQPDVIEPIPPVPSPASILKAFETDTDELDAITDVPPEYRDEISNTHHVEQALHDAMEKTSLSTPHTIGSEIHDIFDSLEETATAMTHTPSTSRTPQDIINTLNNASPEKILPQVEPKAYAQPLSTPPLESTPSQPAYVVPINTTIPLPQKNIKGVSQAELASPEVTSALHGLLQEWPLFSGSGIFGIGPNGHEHPLFKKLSSLSMGEVLSGRWEKADAKTLKTLKEYVDAWRHEQAIAYTVNETFEHYLRRVVQRILKRKQQM